MLYILTQFISNRSQHLIVSCRSKLVNVVSGVPQGSCLGPDKTPKASPKKRFIVEYSPGLSQDTKSLRSCSGNRAKMLLKGLFESNVIPNISRTSDSFSIVPPIFDMGDWGCSVRDPKTIIVLVVLAFNLIQNGHTTHLSCRGH